ncbi:MAG TPA: hypothetical protein VIQ11_01945 [Mycobacterium sp.]
MTEPDDHDSRWTAFDTEQVNMAAMGVRHPLTTALAFMDALGDPVANLELLGNLVTPESRTRWGDFSAAKAALDAIDEPGYGSIVNRLPGAPDVGYFKILSGVSKGYEVTEERAVMVPAVVTLVWRPEATAKFLPEPGMWLVHQIGDPAKPEDLSHIRTSPGDAPDY